jgi:hypothetical protein
MSDNSDWDGSRAETDVDTSGSQAPTEYEGRQSATTIDESVQSESAMHGDPPPTSTLERNDNEQTQYFDGFVEAIAWEDAEAMVAAGESSQRSRPAGVVRTSIGSAVLVYRLKPQLTNMLKVENEQELAEHEGNDD